MITRRLDAADLPQARRLWMTCFGDEENYVNRFFSQFQDGAVLLEDDQLCSMVLCLAVSYVQPDGNAQKGAYLYAVCTQPPYRGRGYSRAVMSCAEQLLKAEGCDFAFLRPADDGLAAMYQKFGYHMTLTNAETQIKAKPQRCTKIQPLSASAYLQMRRQLLSDSYIDWPLSAIRYAAQLGDLLRLEQDGQLAIAAVERYEDKLFIKEYLGAETLAGAIPTYYGVASASCRSRGDTPFAMTKALTDKPLPCGYPGFVFD